jgi:Nrap protein PAP/OAS1-like domain 5
MVMLQPLGCMSSTQGQVTTVLTFWHGCHATATGVAGFLRVLALLAGHPWSVRPLVIDPASEMGPADRHAVVQVHSMS